MTAERWGRQAWVLAAVALVYAAMRVIHGAAVCLDGDEIFSVGSAMHDWPGMMQAIGRDSIHPPLFYVLLKFWIAIGGTSLFWVRLLPALFSTLAVIPAVLLGRELGLRPVVITTTIGLSAVHPLLLFYAQHVRMYSLLMFCTLASIWVFHACLRPGRHSFAVKFVVLTLVNTVAVYVQNYGWLIIGLECFYVLVWKREYLKRMVVSAAVVAAAFAPWAYWVSRFIVAKGGLSSNLAWIQKPDAGALAWCFVNLAGFGDFPSIGRQAVAGLALLIVGAGYFTWKQRAHLDGGQFQHVARFLLYFLFGSIAVPFVASWLLPSSVWGQRHITYLCVAIMMLAAAAYWQLNVPSVRIAGGLLGLVWIGLCVHHHLKGDDKKTPFDKLAVEMLAQEAGNPEPVTFYSVDKYLHYPVWFYLETLKAGRITGFATPLPADRAALAAGAARITVKNHVGIDEARGAHFWVGYSSAWEQKQSPEQILTARGCRVGADVTVSDRYHSSTVFPAWCGE